MSNTTVPSLIVTNGNVVTLDQNDSRAEAIAVAGEHICAIGSNAELSMLAGSETRRVDAKGHLVVPGLIDGHAHMDREGLKDVLPSLADCTSIADILDRIRELARETPAGEWIVTMPIGTPPFYENVPGCLKENRFPTRHELDEAAPDHPVYIRPIWGHWRNTLPLVSIANTRALEIAGITRNTLPPAPSIQIDKELSSGEPSGILYEFTYKPLVEKTLMKCIPAFTLEERVWGLERSMAVYNGYGTTSIFEGHGIAGEVFAAYQQLHEAGPLPVRAQLMFSPAWTSTTAEDVNDLLVDWGRWLARKGLGDSYLRMAGLYTESDYSNENMLRACCGPYTGWAGFNFDSALPEDIMLEMMVEAAQSGIRIGSFTPNILDLYESVHKRVSIDEQRWLIEHIGMFNAGDIERIKELGLVLQAYTSKWIAQDGEALLKQHGHAACDQVVPMRSLLDAGVRVSLATDNVPPTLFVPIQHVVTRKTDSGETIGPDQAISRTEALACASREGAWLSFEENDKGTLEVGKFADMAILSDDLLSVDESRISDIRSVMTMTGGRIVHADSGFE